MSRLGRNVKNMVLKWKSKWVSTSLTSTIEVLREEVELSNMRTAYVMHIPNTLSLISASNNREENSNSVCLLQSTSFSTVTSGALFHGGYLVVRIKRCAVQNQRTTLSYFSLNKHSRSLRYCDYDFDLK